MQTTWCPEDHDDSFLISSFSTSVGEDFQGGWGEIRGESETEYGELCVQHKEDRSPSCSLSFRYNFSSYCLSTELVTVIVKTPNL